MKDLIIIGARGLGREIYNLATECHGYNIDWSIKGFLDDKFKALDDYPGYPPIIDSVESYKVKPNDIFVCALGDVNQKYKYVKIIKEKGGLFLSLVHPASTIYHGTEYGEGFILFPYTIISCNIKIGDFVTIHPCSVLGHDIVLGDYCNLSPHSFLGGFVKTGNFTTIHPGAKIISGLQIGNNTIIGTGSVVIKNVLDNSTVFGSPAKIIYTG
jgi:sugar O-acyltransferase (sialic acid O-acetyltransferase NeuD family)